jgi:hypothetical protein
MVRLVAVSLTFLSLLTVAAEAGTASARFSVGITITGSGTSQRAASAPVPAITYTWGAAAISARHAGFAKLQRVERSGTLYWFAAEKDGALYRIAISIHSGAIVKVIPA